MQRSENINELATALAKAQGAIKNAKKDTVNPYFKSKYSDLAGIWDACRQPLADNGLSVSQLAETATEGMLTTVVTTILMHSSGQWISSTLDIHAQKQDPQGIGSAITYARRYSLAAICGIATEDDDGESAMDRTKQQETKQSLEKVKGLAQEVLKEIAPTLADVRKAAKDAIAKFGKEAVLEVMKNNGWAKADDIPADHYEEAIKILGAIQ